MSTPWISKPGFVTLATSVALHVAAAAFVGVRGAKATTQSAPSLLVVEMEQAPVDETVPQSDSKAEPTPEVKTVSHVRTVSAHAGTAKGESEGAVATAEPAPLVDASPIVPARFVMAAPIAFAPRTVAASAGVRGEERASAAPLAADQVGVPARLLSRAPVVYPPQARAQEIETDVRVEIVLDESGRVVDARSLSNAGYGLDEAALRAIRQYRFSAGDEKTGTRCASACAGRSSFDSSDARFIDESRLLSRL